MELQVHSLSGGKKTTSLQVSDHWGVPYRSSVVHQVVTAYQAGARAGTKAQKSRAEVRGGGAKPWRQKGTGRARVGSSRSPIWEGGGKTFAAKPRDHSQKVNRKMYRSALRGILSELLRQERLIVVDQITLESPKTKLLTEQLKRFEMSHGLILVTEDDVNIYLAARNLPNICVVPVNEMDPVSLVGANKVIVTIDAIKKIEENIA